MELKNYDDELKWLSNFYMQKDKNGIPMIVKNDEHHLIKVNPNIDIADIFSLLNFMPKLVNSESSCMKITTTELIEIAYMNSTEREYNLFVRQANTLISKQTGISLYRKTKESRIELILPDFQYYFNKFIGVKDSNDIDKEKRIEYAYEFADSIKECITQNDISVVQNNK